MMFIEIDFKLDGHLSNANKLTPLVSRGRRQELEIAMVIMKFSFEYIRQNRVHFPFFFHRTDPFFLISSNVFGNCLAGNI